ncbi:hypothetical protein ABZY05_49375 [Streptomyces canus]|uniref:hypothetical protein n=1 Tax=Streptomyces canus TaxID=58343 RepID=UPI00339FF1CF
MRQVDEEMHDRAQEVARRRASLLRLQIVGVLSAFGVAIYVGQPRPWALPWLLLGPWLVLGCAMYMPLSERNRREALHIASDFLREHEGRARLQALGQLPPSVPRYLTLPARVPDREMYWLCTFLGLSLFGVRALLASLDTHSGLSPSDAPAIVGAAVGLPGLIAAAVAAAPRIIRAWGAKARDTGAGHGASAAGQAELIRAEKEGEAAILRAKAELKRAEAELKRAEAGLDPLPPMLPMAPDGSSPLPAPNSNGDGATANSPTGGSPAT